MKIKAPEPFNRSSKFTFLKPLQSYFGGEWSFAHAKLPVETCCICGFGEMEGRKERILTLGSDGSFYSFVYDSEKGGDMKLEKFYWFLNKKI